MTQPQFSEGDRAYSHYIMRWVTVKKIDHTVRNATHGVTGSPLPDTTWYKCEDDDGRTHLLDDGHGNWDMARLVPPRIASRYGYGQDPKS